MAIYACDPQHARGRRVPEEESAFRSCFQRDRDRIIHSSAFRRLKHKTQVFVEHEGDFFRTRLTHSIEVAQVARTMSNALGLNTDLTEAVALAHDLGHTPFGHTGEDALHELMAPYGGFDHNAQALHIVSSLERHYAEFDGLNLTWDTLEGIAKHNGPLLPLAEGEDLPVTLAEYNARHDLELLAARFGASIEQVAHRLSTLQRPGAKGIPFFFARVDQAGTITKRHSATRLQFARFGGACPLWNVHRAFETPGRFLRQLAETPDGVRYVLLARDVTKRGGHFGAPVRRYAMALGCEVKHAGALVYADGLDLARDGAFEPIGISCRICERTDCHQRSVPPLEKRLSIRPDRRDVLPYSLE